MNTIFASQSTMANQISKLNEDALEALELEGTKSYFSHAHKLTVCSFLDGYSASCNYCNKIIRNPIPAYCCIDCEFFIHICCADIKEEDVKHHPFHRQHLHISPMSKGESKECKACTKKIRGVSLSCLNSCRFDLHVSCIKPSPRPLKHKGHRRHSLFYFKDKSLSSLKCCVCCKECEGSFYRCVDCDKNFHVECIPLQRVVKNDKAHKHPLMLLSSLKLVSDGEDYCCDICDKQGNAGNHVYYCDECNFISHVECVLHDHEDDISLEIEETQSDHGAEEINKIMNNFQLVSQEDIQKSNKRESIISNFCQHVLKVGTSKEECKATCSYCKNQIWGLAYICFDCGFVIDESCMDKPQKQALKHSCHKHNLFYFVENGDNFNHLSCEICSKICRGGFYRCPECGISFHVDCIPLPRSIVLMGNTSYRLTIILLDLVIEDDDSDHAHHCEFCKKRINSEDHVYYCQDRNFFAHIECLLAEGSIISSSVKLLPLDPELEQVDELQEVDTEKGEKIEQNIRKDDTSLHKPQQPNPAEDESSIEQKAVDQEKQKRQAEEGLNEQVEQSIMKNKNKNEEKLHSGRSFWNSYAPPKGFIDQYVNPATQRIQHGIRNLDNSFRKNHDAENVANSNAPIGQNASSSLNQDRNIEGLLAEDGIISSSDSELEQVDELQEDDWRSNWDFGTSFARPK